MSEKRIFIAEIGQRNCPLMTFDNICVLDKDCENHACEAGLTRTEAVERMAKAIYFKACGTMKHYAKCKKEYIPFAKAALDALLK